MYDKDLCLFLMSKTFKKSATDAYESFYYIHDIIENLQVLQSSEIKIASLGGGPGSDIVGLVGYLCDRFGKNIISNKTLDLTVYDIMDQNWKAAANKPLNWGLYHYVNTKSSTRTVDDRVKFKHIDFKDPNTVPVSELKGVAFISICWALNEVVFNVEFWTAVLKNTTDSILFFVEGKNDQLDQLNSICASLGRKTIHLKYENPRRLIVLKTSTSA